MKWKSRGFDGLCSLKGSFHFRVQVKGMGTGISERMDDLVNAEERKAQWEMKRRIQALLCMRGAVGQWR